MEMQIRKDDITKTRIVDRVDRDLADGEIRVRCDRVGYSANNVTYAAAGDTLNYWKFFPTDNSKWGLVPVWGFANVETSNCEGVETGERLFGYFPPASTLILKPIRLGHGQFIDGSSHRADLPVGYNIYRRVKPASQDEEDRQMLLFPLYVTSWCLWDALQVADWYGAERIVIASASSKTAIGTAFAISRDDTSPNTVGLTSQSNVEFVQGLGLYDQVLSYDDLETIDADVPTAIIDMSGNASMLGRLHAHLGDQMKHTLDVGLTHWEAPRRDQARNKDRSTFFFAPAHIQGRTKEWGAKAFAERTQEFMQAAIDNSRTWLELEHLSGLESLAQIHTEVATGKSKPAAGYVFQI